MSFYGNVRDIYDSKHHNFYPDVAWLFYPLPGTGANPRPNSEIAFNMDLAEKY